MQLWKIIRRLKHIKSRLVTDIWYRSQFQKVGCKTKIEQPITYSSPDCIEIGNNVYIGPYCRIEAFPGYGGVATSPRLKIGNSVCIQHAVHLWCASSLILEDFVLIASGCMSTDENHGMTADIGPYVSQALITKPTILKKGVWLGENVCVTAGSSIGEWSIVGSNSVVSGNIPAYSIAVGSPAKVIKAYCFETKQWIKCV